MRRVALPPYHLFERRGMHFAYDVDQAKFLRVDEAASEYLQALLDGSPQTAAEHLAGRFGAETAERVRGELDHVRQVGLLRGPVTFYDDRDYRAQTRRLVKLGTPRIELYLAEACNLRCRYCYVADNDALGNGLMPREVARAAVDLVFRRSGDSDFVQITFFGGEPLLNKPVLVETIEYSQWLGRQRGKDVRYSMTTNGTLLDDQVIDLIKRHNFGLMISMDGPPEVQNDHRPFPTGEGSFEVAARAVKALMQRRRMVTVRCTLTRRHLNLTEIVEFLERFGFTRIALSRCSGKSYCLGEWDIGPDDLPIIDEQSDRLLERALQKVARGEPLRHDPITGALRGVRDSQRAPALRCGVCRGCTTVGIDGSLYPCHRYVGMKRYVVGHVRTGVNEQAHARYLGQYFRTKQKCSRCWLLNWCGGLCPWYVSHEDGTSRPPPEWRCAAVRESAEESAWLYEYVKEHHPSFFARVVEMDDKALLGSGKPTPTGDGSTGVRVEGQASLTALSEAEA